MGGARSREQGRNKVRGGRKGGGKTPGQQIQMRKKHIWQWRWWCRWWWRWRWKWKWRYRGSGRRRGVACIGWVAREFWLDPTQAPRRGWHTGTKKHSYKIFTNNFDRYFIKNLFGLTLEGSWRCADICTRSGWPGWEEGIRPFQDLIFWFQDLIFQDLIQRVGGEN